MNGFSVFLVFYMDLHRKDSVCSFFIYFRINAIMRIQWLGNQTVLFHIDYKLQMIKGPIDWKEFFFKMVLINSSYIKDAITSNLKGTMWCF